MFVFSVESGLFNKTLTRLIVHTEQYELNDQKYHMRIQEEV